MEQDTDRTKMIGTCFRKILIQIIKTQLKKIEFFIIIE